MVWCGVVRCGVVWCDVMGCNVSYNVVRTLVFVLIHVLCVQLQLSEYYYYYYLKPNQITDSIIKDA